MTKYHSKIIFIKIEIFKNIVNGDTENIPAGINTNFILSSYGNTNLCNQSIKFEVISWNIKKID